MSTVRFPEYVEAFVERTNEFLGSFEAKLVLSEEREENSSRVYEMEAPSGVAQLLVHRTLRSRDSAVGEYRARTVTTLPDDLAAWFQGKENIANRYATLGLLITNKTGADVGSQCLIRPDSIETLAGTLAAAMVHAGPSIIQSIRQGVAGETSAPVETLSAWSNLDFEQIHYDYAHLGTASLGQRKWSIRLNFRNLLTLAAVHDNPYWRGGLLSLLSVPGADLTIDGEMISIHSLNSWEYLVGEAPTFGGWCRDGNDFVFASFAPNFLKSLPDFTDHLINWATIRAHTAKGFADLERSYRETRGTPAG